MNSYWDLVFLLNIVSSLTDIQPFNSSFQRQPGTLFYIHAIGDGCEREHERGESTTGELG